MPSERPNWLCIAYAFPPINRSGTHRTLAFVRQLDRLGWNASVLTVLPCGETLDADLLKLVPPSTTIVRTKWWNLLESVKRFTTGRSPQIAHADQKTRSKTHSARSYGLKEWLSRLLITPDSRMGWIPPAIPAGWNVIRSRRPQIIYSTSPYSSAHLIALVLSRLSGTPWIADFRDPWRDNPFRRLGFASLDGWDAWLEWLGLKAASHIVCNTPTQQDALCARFPWAASKCTTILNGIDFEDLADVAPTRIVPNDKFVFLHAGQFYGNRSPKPWLEALKQLKCRTPDLASRVRFLLVGTSSYDGGSLVHLAQKAGVGDMVTVVGPRSFRQTMSLLSGADALLLAGASGPGAHLQVPNKLFEYLAFRKPILAALDQKNPGIDILHEAKAHAVICPPDDAGAISGGLESLARRRSAPPHLDWSGVGRFDRAHRGRRLWQIFQEVRLWGRRASAQPNRDLHQKRRGLLAGTL